MTKSELVSVVRVSADLTWDQAHSAVDSLFSAIETTVSRGETVTVTGFGKFTPRVRAARKGRNLKTGEPMDVAAKNVVSFKAGKGLKEALNA